MRTFTVASGAPVSFPLLRHPSTQTPCPYRVEVTVCLGPEHGLDLLYRLSGDLSDIIFPTIDQILPREKLWARTCCELFVRTKGSPAYREFNFSPNGQWMIYDFTSLRVRAQNGPPLSLAPALTPSASTRDTFTLPVHIDPTLLPPGPLEANITTVVEKADGTHHYWALHHPHPQPDFHDPNGFCLEITT